MGGGSAPQRNFGNEWPQITAGYKGQENQLENFLSSTTPGSPGANLNQAGNLASFYNSPGNLSALMAPVAQWASAFSPQSISALTGPVQSWSGANTPEAIGQLTSGLRSFSGDFNPASVSQLTNQFSPSATARLTQPFQTALSGTINPEIASGGNATPAEQRNVAQSLLPYFSSQGTGRSQTSESELAINEDQYRQQRFNTALGQAQTATGDIQGLQTGAATTTEQIRGAGLSGTSAINTGIEQLNTQGQTNQSQIAQLIQGLRGAGSAGTTGVSNALQNIGTGGLNQLAGTAQAQVGSFSQLTNPILSYLGNLFGENLQASSQAQTASGNKSSGIGGGALSAVGAVLPLLATASDERIKTKIRSTGIKTPSGIELKTYEFKTRPGVAFIGPMAQDVEKKKKSAVLRDPVTGLKYVDFSQIDAPMIELPSMMKAA